MNPKTQILLTCSLLLLASCASTKHSTVDATTIRDATVIATKQVASSIDSTIDIDVVSNINKEIVVEEFDSSQPIDILTGAPPLKKRVTERAVKNVTKKERTTTDILSTSATVEDATITHRSEIKATNKEESRPVIIRVLLTSALSAFLLILGYILIFYIYKQWQEAKNKKQ